MFSGSLQHQAGQVCIRHLELLVVRDSTLLRDPGCSRLKVFVHRGHVQVSQFGATTGNKYMIMMMLYANDYSTLACGVTRQCD